MDGNIIFDSGKDKDFYYKHDDVVTDIINSVHKEEHGIKHIGRGFHITYYWEIIGDIEQPNGILIMATAHDTLSEAYQKLWLILTIVLTIAFLVILLISSRSFQVLQDLYNLQLKQQLNLQKETITREHTKITIVILACLIRPLIYLREIYNELRKNKKCIMIA